jgi:hypothetical protein
MANGNCPVQCPPLPPDEAAWHFRGSLACQATRHWLAPAPTQPQAAGPRPRLRCAVPSSPRPAPRPRRRLRRCLAPPCMVTHGTWPLPPLPCRSPRPPAPPARSGASPLCSQSFRNGCARNGHGRNASTHGCILNAPMGAFRMRSQGLGARSRGRGRARSAAAPACARTPAPHCCTGSSAGGGWLRQTDKQPAGCRARAAAWLHPTPRAPCPGRPPLPRPKGDYESVGAPVGRTKLLPMKTPLSREILSDWQLPQPPRHSLTIGELLEDQAAAGRRVGCIIDLSNHGEPGR